MIERERKRMRNSTVEFCVLIVHFGVKLNTMYAFHLEGWEGEGAWKFLKESAKNKRFLQYSVTLQDIAIVISRSKWVQCCTDYIFKHLPCIKYTNLDLDSYFWFIDQWLHFTLFCCVYMNRAMTAALLGVAWIKGNWKVDQY